MWLDQVRQAGTESFTVHWKPYSLEQVNQKVGEEYHVWDEPTDKLPPGIWALRAGVAAGRQGEEQLGQFLPLLLEARHVDRMELDDKDMLRSLAEQAGLDVERFQKDMEDPSSLEEVAASHTKAVEEHGVFGTPTFVFPDGASAFLKMLRPDTLEEAAKAFKPLMEIMQGETFIGEVKRPQPPWPKGVFTHR